MKQVKQHLEDMRKSPSQQRARETVSIILEAAARILERDGPVAFNTNAVAELAGISVGTLYHYFQNKDAILIAMAREELRAHRTVLVEAVTEARSVREIVKALISVSTRRLNAREIATNTLIAHGLGDELAKPLQATVEALQATEAWRPLLPDSPTSLFVLTRAVNGVIAAAVRERSHLLSSQSLEDELVRLIERYLAAGE
jgi:AcrR family transcriptional regulator